MLVSANRYHDFLSLRSKSHANRPIEIDFVEGPICHLNHILTKLAEIAVAGDEILVTSGIYRAVEPVPGPFASYTDDVALVSLQ